MRAAGRKAKRPEPIRQAKLVQWYLTFRVPLHHAAIPETEIQTACEQFNYWVNNHTHILKFENMATQRFVEFCFESIKLDEYITGAAQPKIVAKLDALSAETQPLKIFINKNLPHWQN